MILQVYKNAFDFLDKIQTYLLEDEAGNNLILGIALGLKQQQLSNQRVPYFATVERDDRLTMAVLMTPPSSLVLFSPYQPDEKACEIIAQDLLSGGWHVRGGIGIPALSKTFAETWQRLTGMDINPYSQSNLYKLEEVIWPNPMPSGTLCPTTLQDIPLIEDWLYKFQKESLRLDDHQEMRYTTEDVLASHSLHVWVDGGRPVAMAAGRRSTPNGISIAMVYTPPEFRKKGYASACVASLCQYYLDSGKSFCSLFADAGNPTANQVYSQIGFQKINETIDYHFITNQK